MIAEFELQTAIYTALTGNTALMAIVTGGVHDHVPQSDDGEPLKGYPYLVIGDETVFASNTDDSSESEHNIQIDVWSRYRGRKEIKQIMSAVHTVLHRTELTVENATFVHTEFDDIDIFLEPDGLTRHGVMQFMVKLDEAE